MPHLQLYPRGLDIRLEGQEKDHQFYYYLHQSVWSSIQGIWNPYQPMWYGLGYSTKQRTCPCLRVRIRHKSHKDRTNTNLPSKIWHKDRTSTNLQREQKVRLSTLQEQIQHYPGAQLVTENKSCSDDAKKSSTSRWFNTVGQHNENSHKSIPNPDENGELHAQHADLVEYQCPKWEPENRYIILAWLKLELRSNKDAELLKQLFVRLMTRETRAYIRTISVSSYNLAILWEFPDSVDLRLMKGTHNKVFLQNSKS